MAYKYTWTYLGEIPVHSTCATPVHQLWCLLIVARGPLRATALIAMVASKYLCDFNDESDNIWKKSQCKSLPGATSQMMVIQALGTRKLIAKFMFSTPMDAPHLIIFALQKTRVPSDICMWEIQFVCLNFTTLSLHSCKRGVLLFLY